MKESYTTTPEEIIFEELQSIGQRYFSDGGKYYENSESLNTFIHNGRAKITHFLSNARERDINGFNELELKEYDDKQSNVLEKFNYLFLHPDTQITYDEISKTSF